MALAATRRREACHELYGKEGEDCLVEELEEKRILAHIYCKKEARKYYGEPGGEKALCSRMMESFAFTDPSKSSVEVIRAHQEARSSMDAKTLKICRNIVYSLSECLGRSRSSVAK